jgi:hypothetical protein
MTTDSELLNDLQRKFQLIEDRVSSVVHGYHTACYLVGRPGTSKTFTVKKELERLAVHWFLQNARMTPMGLFSVLAEHPEHVVVLDDVSSLFANDQAMQILLAALDGEPKRPRTVSYRSKDIDMKVIFTGSIIAISNVPLRCDPLARALGSRVVQLEHEPSDDEIAAFMRHLAAQGIDGLSSNECTEVADFIVGETLGQKLRLDLRHLNKAWQDYRQWKDKKAKSHWKDLVRTSLKKLASEPLVPRTKKDEIDLQRQKVRDALKRFPNDTPAQIAASGLKSSTFYARRKEVIASTST